MNIDNSVFPNIEDKDFIEKLQNKKEFIQRKFSKDKPEDEIDRLIRKDDFFIPHEEQRLARDFLNPNTPYNFLLIMHPTGRGKTITSLLVALEFTKIFRKEYNFLKESDKTIFIIGFNTPVFKRTLITRPEFGYVSKDEVQQLKKLEELESGGLKTNIDALRDFRRKLKRRLTNKKYGGFFKFIGYKKLVNLFVGNPKKISQLENFSEDYLLDNLSNLIGENKISVDESFLNSFNNSIVICDEIHNVYNSKEKNNYGLVLRLILSVTNVKAIFLSATPISNKPSEVVELMHLIAPDNTEISKIKRSDLFTSTEQLLPGALDKINDAFVGKVSYYSDINVKSYPQEIILGDSLPGQPKDFPMKFTRVEFGKEHQNMYNSVYVEKLNKDNKVEELDEDDESDEPSDTRYLLDFIFPISVDGVLKYGYSKNDIKYADPSVKSEFNGNSLLGEFLSDNKYFMKYSKAIDYVIDSIKDSEKNGKIFMYHRYVHMSGVLFLQELLINRGFLLPNMSVSDNSICSICGINFKNHKNRADYHEFIATRFINVNSEISKDVVDKMLQRYNNPDNLYGHQIKILLGSNVMKESYDLKAVRHVIILSRPDNISTYKQIIGRAIRNNSHAALPIEKQNVYVNIFVHKMKQESSLSYEEKKYLEKIMEYKIIEKIESKIKSNSIDRNLYNDKNLTNISLSKLDTITFDVFNNKEEIKEISIIIKRLFLMKDTWTYDKLWINIRDPPFIVYENTNLFSQANFNMALDNMIYKNTSIIHKEEMTLLESLFNPHNKQIYIDGNYYVIVHIGSYYKLFSLVNNKPLIDFSLDQVGIRSKFDVKKDYINVYQYIQINAETYDFIAKKNNIKNKYLDVPIEQWTYFTCEFGKDFYIRLIEDCIKYVYQTYTTKINSEYHDFYFKLLFYFTNINMIIYADRAGQYKYLYNSVVSGIHKFKSNTESNIIIPTCDNCISFNSSMFDIFMNSAKTLLQKKCVKVPANILPIGHYLDKFPKIYNPKTKVWINALDLITRQMNIKENDIIIGFYKRTKIGINVKFKLRYPLHSTLGEKSDKRKIEKGMSCSSKSREFLEDLVNQLGIKIDSSKKKNIRILCESIRIKLLENEEKEQEKPENKRIKWFYYQYEEQPITKE